MNFRFRTRLWLHEGVAAWHFVTLPTEISGVILGIGQPPRGFGAIRVKATIGRTRWDTSIFPDSKSGSYVLPIKKQVRLSERLSKDDLVDVVIDVPDPGT